MVKKLMKGNEAVVVAALNAGCRFYTGYPITPQSEISEYMAERMPSLGGTFIQSEAELTSINMIFGSAACGVRSMTSSAGPGMSLFQEGLSFLAAAELPSVIINMMRSGPGLGNIRASQSDYFQAIKGGGHGDYNNIVLAPANLQEMYDLTMAAFDYADYYRNTCMIMADGILATMFEAVEAKEYKPILDLPSKKTWELDGCKGREAHVIKTLVLRPPNALIEQNKKLQAKYRKIENELCLCEEYLTEDADFLLTGYGICARVCKEAVDVARKKGIKLGLIRPITLWPFPKKIYAKYNQDILVVEMSAGQFVEDVRLSSKSKIHYIGWGGGWYPDSAQVLEKVNEVSK